MTALVLEQMCIITLFMGYYDALREVTKVSHSSDPDSCVRKCSIKWALKFYADKLINKPDFGASFLWGPAVISFSSWQPRPDFCNQLARVQSG